MGNSNRLDRKGKRVISAFIEDDAFEKFKGLAAKKNITTDAMIREGLSLLFKQSGESVPPALLKKPRAAYKIKPKLDI